MDIEGMGIGIDFKTFDKKIQPLGVCVGCVCMCG